MYNTYSKVLRPRKISFSSVSEDGSFGRCVVSHIPAGCGQTVGNSMRRVLLSSLSGARISSITIDGVLHEFSTIPGVCQDVLNIERNMQEVVFKTEMEGFDASLEVVGPKVVTAGMINVPRGAEVVNKDHFLFEVQDGVKVVIKLTVMSGIGHIFQELDSKKQSLGTIYPDMYFSPVKKVSHSVEQVRIDKQTCYDELTMEIKTDGSIGVEEAVAISSGILRDLLECFMHKGTVNVLSGDVSKEEEQGVPVYNYNLLTKIDDLDLSVRSRNCLSAADCKYVGDIVKKTEQDMLQIANFGRKSLDEIRSVLSGMKLSLGADIGEWPPKNMSELLAMSRRNASVNG